MSLKVGIICAGDTEVEPFIPCIEECKISEKAMLRFYEGKIEGVEVVVLYSGVCKVNAAIATQILIDTYKASVIINAGTAGGMNKQLQLFDTVISTEIAYHDVDEGILTEFHPWMESIYFKADKELLELTKRVTSGEKFEQKIYWGRMITGETFIEEEKRDEINTRFDPLCVDMETASIAHVCYVNGIPFIAIRSITDTEEHCGVDVFEENCEKASILSMEVVSKMLIEMKKSSEKSMS